jgi:TetR/AcrR family transcriptional repressor of mexJK operon
MKPKFSPKRGRPNAEQVTAIDQAILVTARRIFFSEGFDALAMDAVAAELGISKGTLYSRHQSKEALLCAVIKDTISGWSDASSSTDHLLPEEIGARLREHVRRIGHKSIEPDAQILNQLWQTVRFRVPEMNAIFHDVGYARVIEVISTDIRIAAERDAIPAKDPVSVAEMIYSSLTGWLLNQERLEEVTPADVDEFAQRLTDLVMAARSAW